MKQYLSALIVIICSVYLSGCASERKPPSVNEPQLKQTPAPSISGNIALAPFDQVVINGPSNIIINGQQAQTQLLVHGDINTIKTVKATVSNGILHIEDAHFVLGNSDKNNPPTVELDLANPIHQLTYHGSGQLITNNVGDSSLAVEISGNANVSMKGNLVLSKIQVEDNAVLHAYWINSSHIELLTQDNAKIFLAGIVTNMNLIASDDSDVDAKYLRVESAFVRAMDDADVAVNVKHSLSSWSTERSSIYYYRDPNFGSHYLADSGASLRMVGLPQQ